MNCCHERLPLIYPFREDSEAHFKAFKGKGRFNTSLVFRTAQETI